MRLPTLPERIAFGWILAAIVVLLCLVACGGPAGSITAISRDPEKPLLIYVVNDSSRTLDEVQLATAQVQRQLDEEVHRYYGISSSLVIADPIAEEDYRVYLLDRYQGNSNVGYYSGNQAWVATILPGWSNILSHEVIEMQLGEICDVVSEAYGDPTYPVENFLLPGGGSYLDTQRRQ